MWSSLLPMPSSLSTSRLWRTVFRISLQPLTLDYDGRRPRFHQPPQGCPWSNKACRSFSNSCPARSVSPMAKKLGSGHKSLHSSNQEWPASSLLKKKNNKPKKPACFLFIQLTSCYLLRVCQSLSCVRLFATRWTVACQAPLSTEFSSPFPSPGDLPDPGMEPWSPALQVDSLPSELPGKSRAIYYNQIRSAPFFPSLSFHMQKP